MREHPVSPPAHRPPGHGPPRPALARATLAVALVVQLLVLYLPRTTALPGTTLPGADLLVHLVVFAGVTLAALRAGVPAWAVLAYGVAQATLSEVVQHLLLPGRTGEGSDMAADLLGVALGLVLGRARRRGAQGLRTRGRR